MFRSGFHAKDRVRRLFLFVRTVGDIVVWLANLVVAVCELIGVYWLIVHVFAHHPY